MLPTLREMYGPDFVIVNGENSAAGKGITPEIVRCMLQSGVDVITLGNHAWGRSDIIEYIDRERAFCARLTIRRERQAVAPTYLMRVTASASAWST